MSEVAVRVEEQLEQLPAEQWNALAHDDNPFLRHEFLSALERQGCVGDGTGWLPRHLVIEDETGIAAACPLYVKLHSYGEFVFDWAWADAWERAGQRYYPKLVVAVPFTPVTGPRLLVRPGADREPLAQALVAGALELARRVEASSVHWLFPTGAEADALEQLGLLRRAGCQFHWHNPGHADFDAFLATLTSKRRKQIRRERREAAGAPVSMHMSAAADMEPRRWREYHALYTSTYDRKWGYPPLTAGWFEELARSMPRSLLLSWAERDGRMVAGAHFLLGGNVLYGRNWGASEFHPSLHFELCYYRAIEYCIAHGIERFEAGAQGEHKLTRGFLPTTPWSSHWLAHAAFRRGVADFLRRERAGVDAYIDEMDAHTPFRRADGDVTASRRAG